MSNHYVIDPPLSQLFTAGGQGDLLTEQDPDPVKFACLDGTAPLILICDHAANYLPGAVGDLGIDHAALARHVAWDIGAEKVTRSLARRLGAPAVFSHFSRLVIDPNRVLSSAGSIPKVSDGLTVPGNQALDGDDRQRRVDSLFKPYHGAVVRLIEAQLARGITPALVFMHSFTPVMEGFERPWEVGLLWDQDDRLTRPLLNALAAKGICVGDNEPYSGRSLEDYSLHAHAESRGLPYSLVEIRQDLIDRPRGVEHWAAVFEEVLTPLLEDPAVFQPLKERSKGAA
ncbi:N-formylglutamate amidohydrolase [Rhodovibrionaceae bacterium A322]